jgi:DNA helicase-2/ATP-dependent DNA helicase PcrA
MLNERQQEAVEYTEGPLLILAGAGAGKTKTIVERIIHIIKNGVEPKKILAITFTNKAAKEMRERIIKRMEEEGMLENITGEYSSADSFSFGPEENNHPQPLLEKEGRGAQLNNPFSYLYRQMPMIKTFHSLGMYILQEEYLRANLTKRLTIYDEGDSLAIVKDILDREGIDPKMHEPRRVKGTISRIKSDLVDMNEYRTAAFSPFQKVVARVWPQYEAELEKQKVVDFDDLIVKTLKLLQNNADIREKYQNKWQYLHIDEYQDTNTTQYLLSKILGEKHKNICAVGDVDQNIYSWRGANLKNLLAFEKDFTTADRVAKVILLEQNYRSTKNIIAAANGIIKLNKVRKEKNLFTENEEGEVITIYTGYDDRQESMYIAKKIKELVESGVPGKEICVLYRTNFQSRGIEQALLAENIKYQVLGTRFFDRKEVKDVMSYLRLAENTESVEDLKRAISNPSRGFGKVALTKILSGNIGELPKASQDKLRNFYKVIDEIKELIGVSLPSEVILKIIKSSGMEEKYKEVGDEEATERLGNIYELVTLATEYDKYGETEGITKFLEEASLVSDQDTDTGDETAVKCMTIHASKGLEFHYVFIAGLEDDLFPSKRMNAAKPTAEESEEERRLFYVALTRARKKLFLTNAKNRMLYGKRQMQFRSEFLDDIPEGLTVEEEEYYSDSSNGHEKIVVYL